MTGDVQNGGRGQRAEANLAGLVPRKDGRVGKQPANLPGSAAVPASGAQRA